MGVLQIIGLVFRFGPSLVEVAWKVYKLIEEYAHKKESDPSSYEYDGEKAPSTDKAQRFDIVMKARTRDLLGKDLSVSELEDIRERVHKVMNRKRGKAK